MEATERLVRTWVASGRDQEIQETATGMLWPLIRSAAVWNVALCSILQWTNYVTWSCESTWGIPHLWRGRTADKGWLNALTRPCLLIWLILEGVEFLSAVLGHCPHEKLNRQAGRNRFKRPKKLIERHAARVLMTFFCSKLDDTETVIPALKGLKVLVVFPTSTSTDAIEIIRAYVGWSVCLKSSWLF